MLNSVAPPRAQRRKSSRDSTSSSVVTVRKAASISSRSGSRTPHSATRPRSPDSLGPQLTALMQSSFEPGYRRKRSSSWSRPGSSTGVNDGVENLNRWSQSTASSNSGGEGLALRKRKSRTSRHMSFGSLPIFSASSTLDVIELPPTEPRTKPRPPPKESWLLPDANSKLSSLKLPALESISMAQHPSITPETLSTGTPSAGTATPQTNNLLTPSSAVGGRNDYFGEQWKTREGRSPQKYNVTSSYNTAHRREATQQRNASPRQAQPESKPVKPAKVGGGPVVPNPQDNLRPNHTRDGEAHGNGMSEILPGNSASPIRNPPGRSHPRRSPVQKTMLSQALARAHAAVLLDNDQEFDAAIDAYEDACRLLHQVMMRSSEEEDQKKLEAIHTTYANRICELLQTGDFGTFSQDYDSTFDAEIDHDPQLPETENAEFPPRQQSLAPFIPSDVTDDRPSASGLIPSHGISHQAEDSAGRAESIRGQEATPTPLPPPLSPKRPSSPPTEREKEHASHVENANEQFGNHSRALSTETTSWLNNESGGSSASSARSRTSSLPYGASNLGESLELAEADFTAVINAVIDDAYEPAAQEEFGSRGPLGEENFMSTARRNVELAKEAVREVERQAPLSRQILNAYNRHPHQMYLPPLLSVSNEGSKSDEIDLDAEEEERLLEEMTRDFALDNFEFSLQSKSALPRTSDSSSFSGRTHGSSIGSTTVTAGTSLSTLAEAVTSAPKQKLPPPPHPPPAGALPAPPVASSSASSTPTITEAKTPHLLSFDRPSSGPGVRDRRLSGQNAKQLKIETKTTRAPPHGRKGHVPVISLSSIPTPPPKDSPFASAAASEPAVNSLPAGKSTSSQLPTPLTSVNSSDSLANDLSAASLYARTESQVENEGKAPSPSSPSRPNSRPMPPPLAGVRKNFSSSSLRTRNLSNGDTSDMSPNTPSSATFPLTKETNREASTPLPSLPTPTAGTFAAPSMNEGGMYLFEDIIQMPQTPATPNTGRPKATAPLEYCPEAFLLRPFWLMRCLYQTIAHPHGGYLSTKLFIPKDIWRVKNVKLKAVDDKVAQCDLLTAALLKLARVDTCDADAVLEEMQSFEAVMEQARVTLQKKLGSEVGLAGSAGIFKNSPATEESSDPLASKSGNAPGKSYLAGWRKLRSKSSGATINPSHSSITKDQTKDSLTMPTLPMTTTPTSRPPKRNVQAAQFAGPNANYAGALARLFDAVQVIDQVARQVEDPGLKCSSKTHVGLELSTRNAAEFFAFYICRFALADIGTMLDKFIKRGSEWVLI